MNIKKLLDRKTSFLFHTNSYNQTSWQFYLSFINTRLKLYAFTSKMEQNINEKNTIQTIHSIHPLFLQKFIQPDPSAYPNRSKKYGLVTYTLKYSYAWIRTFVSFCEVFIWWFWYNKKCNIWSLVMTLPLIN